MSRSDMNRKFTSINQYVTALSFLTVVVPIPYAIFTSVINLSDGSDV